MSKAWKTQGILRHPQDNPRKLGKNRVRLVGSVPPEPVAKAAGKRGRIHQFLWRRSHVVSDASRNCAAKGDEKPP
jgi:hypothetical protein